VWLRRTFEAERAPQNLWLETYNAVAKGAVYLNGEPVFSLDPQTATSRHYVHVDLSRHAPLVRRGTNVVAIEAETASERRAIDVGLYTIE
jgi:hypothetical protein